MISNTPLIFEESQPGRQGTPIPRPDVPGPELTDILDSTFLRTEPAELPQVTEPEVVRHFVNLSVKNHHIDKDFYPLGSCTMKYNPKINDALASLPEFAKLHPLQSDDTVQGALRLMWELERMLGKITGMAGVTLQPSAGAQGEFTGALIMRRYHDQTSGHNRQFILIPETAHGTNPASVVSAGFKPKVVKSNTRGKVDLDDLKAKADGETAGMMLTQPNTLGLFENDIEAISSIVHAAGGLMYMDGANLNALVGLTRPADMGFDITHINLHKTFSTPHGGGGPGAGPIGVTEELKPFLPVPIIRRTEGGNFIRDYDNPQSIGNVHSFFGNFGVLVRAWGYIRMLGENGVRRMTRSAIINANYLKTKLAPAYNIPFVEGTMHEFVISGTRQKERGVRVLDIAKTLLDFGFHAPTIYFPLNVSESMMIEPTETESQQTLDKFAEAMLEIDKMIDSDPERIHSAPLNTPVRRLDETLANRKPNLRWRP
ncbi:MAG: glycine dehydrogenase subunit 2 [FCB group bacterium]|nr:glycine dehydrogenase subunit 2 [FCB group bacterium]